MADHTVKVTSIPQMLTDSILLKKREETRDMNGIRFIREKSNLTKNALAERMRVTRQTVTQWENGTRRPNKKHLEWLRDFYGIEEKWFGELSDEDLQILKEKKMYRHYDGEKEYLSFIPEKDGWAEISIPCGMLEEMLDDKYSDTMRKKRELIQHVEEYLIYKSKSKVCLFDKINVAERGIKDIERFLALMETVQGVGKESTFLKMPFSYEIKTALYAMMIASGQYSEDEIKDLYSYDFEDERLNIDVGYLKELVDLMSAHWNNIKTKELGRGIS